MIFFSDIFKYLGVAIFQSFSCLDCLHVAFGTCTLIIQQSLSGMLCLLSSSFFGLPGHSPFVILRISLLAFFGLRCLLWRFLSCHSSSGIHCLSFLAFFGLRCLLWRSLSCHSSSGIRCPIISGISLAYITFFGGLCLDLASLLLVFFACHY